MDALGKDLRMMTVKVSRKGISRELRSSSFFTIESSYKNQCFTMIQPSRFLFVFKVSQNVYHHALLLRFYHTALVFAWEMIQFLMSKFLCLKFKCFFSVFIFYFLPSKCLRNKCCPLIEEWGLLVRFSPSSRYLCCGYNRIVKWCPRMGVLIT